MKIKFDLEKDRQYIVNALLSHVKKENYIGIDPSTVRFNPKVLKLINSKIPIIGRFWSKLVYKIIFISGHRLNPIIKPEKLVFAKGLGLIMAGYSFNYKQTKNKSYIDLVDELSEMLIKKKLKNCYLWAHDYDYYIGNVEVTTKTPNLITTAFVALGYWYAFNNMQIAKYKTLYCSIVEDMAQIFPFIELGTNKGCFMYTPNTACYVHNANLLMAELLTYYLSLKDNGKFEGMRKKAIEYSISDFEGRGYIPYAGEPTPKLTFDNYHTGYVLRSLNVVQEYTRDSFEKQRILKVLDWGLDFYIKEFIDSRGFLVRDHLNTIETHSLAEAILMHKIFYFHFDETSRNRLAKAIDASLNLLWNDNKGIFNNTAKPILNSKFYYLDKTDMVRWSQAWMIFALSYGCDLN